jgi:microcystin-dependent protein
MTSKARNLARLVVDSGGAIGSQNLTNAPNPIVAGTIAYLGMNSAPTGWLKANGAAVSRTTYAALFTAIGTTYGVGDGSTTFNLPDLRGEFPRGFDDGRGVDSGRAIGTAQLDAAQRMVGKFRMSHASGLAAQATSGFANPFAGADGASPWRDRIEEAGGGSWTMEFDNSRAVRTSTETRSRNVALLACIKF